MSKYNEYDNGVGKEKIDESVTVGPAGYSTAPDVEKHDAAGQTMLVDSSVEYHPDGAVHRKLKQRHMAMIALGGAIGTGLFIGSGASLSSGGPVSLWLAYTLMAAAVYTMVVALGEMAALFPVSGGFTHYAHRFVDPALGFALGINYWYSYAITMPTEVVAAQIVISYWDTKTPAAAYITVMLVLIFAINFWGARAYGEAEFIFSSIKVITIVGLIILGVVLMCGGGPNHHALGFHYWREGAFHGIAVDGGDTTVDSNWGKFLAFWNVFVQAAFSFLGTEIIATTLGEAENPRRAVPRAIRRVFYRLVFFYVVGIFVMSCIVSSNNPDLLSGSGNGNSSPWVLAIKDATIPVLPSIVNAVFLISAWSAGNSDVYASSRTLYGMALAGQLPRFMRKCTKRGLPIWCVTATCLLGFLAYLNTGGETAVQAFNWLYNISSITGILTWWTILFSYLRFYYGIRKQGLSRASFPFLAPLQPYLSWVGLVFFTLVLLFNGFPVFLRGNWSVSSFFAAYVTIPIYIIAYLGWKIVKKTKMVPLDQIDFDTGRKELDEMAERDAERYKEDTMWKRIMSALF